jgi:Spy/CpxP family protein refolding chaperone
MNERENCKQGVTIKAFLDASRQYLSLTGHRAERLQLSVTPSIFTRSTMSSYRKAVWSFLLAAGVGALAAGPAMADHGCDHMRAHTEHHAKMMKQHHADLHDALKLSADQEPGWKKLMDSEQPGPAMSGGQSEDWAKLNAPERAEKMLELSKVRQARMAEHVAALKAFYASLTPAQQKTFEDFHAAQHRRMTGKAVPKASGTDKAPGK